MQTISRRLVAGTLLLPLLGALPAAQAESTRRKKSGTKAAKSRSGAGSRGVRLKPSPQATYANGDTQEFTSADEFLRCVREELPYRPTTGFHYEVLTNDPAVRKAVDDMAYDFYGEENPRQLDDYQNPPEPGMTFGGM